MISAIWVVLVLGWIGAVYCAIRTRCINPVAIIAVMILGFASYVFATMIRAGL